jgi:hypothetical protein
VPFMLFSSASVCSFIFSSILSIVLNSFFYST